MNPPEIDWLYLRQGLLGAGLALLVCALVWGGTTLYHTRATNILAAEQQRLGGLEAERSELTQRREALRKFAQIYQQLSLDGVVGSEQRLAVIQATRLASENLRLPYLKYTTNPQQAFEAPWLIPGETAPVLVSQLDLQLGLVHELDLLRLLGEIRNAPGRPQVLSCSLEMLGQDLAPDPDKANLTGNCQLALYSIPRESALVAANPEN